MNKSGIELRQYYRAVAKRFWLVLLFVGLVMGVTYWWKGSKPPMYSASTLLIVTNPIVTSPTSAVREQGSSLQTNIAMVINDIIQLIGTRPVTERVAATLSLKGPEVVEKSLQVSRIRDTDLVRINATHSDREIAAKLANTSTEVLVDHFREVNRRDARAMRLFIEQQLLQARARLEASDRAVEAYKIRHGIVEFGAELSQASSDANQARTDRENALKELRESEARLAASTSRLSTEQRMRLVSGTIKDNPAFQQMETRLTDLEIQRATLSQTFTSQHPKMKMLEGEIATVRQQMQMVAKKVTDNEVSEANPIYDQLLTDTVSKQVERAGLQARIDALTFLEHRRRARNASFPRIQTGVNQLARENQVLSENYSSLSNKYQDALLRENEAGYLLAGIQVMEPAVAPRETASVKPSLEFGIAGLIGLLLGIMAVLLLETTDDRIRSSGDAERTFGAPVLAEVPDVAQARVAPATAALLLIAVMLLLGVAFGRVLGKVNPQAQPNVLITLSSRLVRGVEVIPAQAVR